MRTGDSVKIWMAAYSDYRLITQIRTPFHSILTHHVGRDHSAPFFLTTEMSFHKESLK